MGNNLNIGGEIFRSIPIKDNEYFYINESGTKVYNSLSENFIGISSHAHKNGKPYLCVHLHKDKTFDIHRLVAFAWVPNPDNKKTVDHKDRDTLNNHASNLCWATAKEQTANSDNSFKRDKNYQMKMSRKGAEKKSKAIGQYDVTTNELIKIYPSSVAASMELFGDINHNSYINRCANGKIKIAYGYKWRFI